MGGENFQRRVELLRDTWAERRQLRGLAGVHDFESQLALLRTLHGWAEQAMGDIVRVYDHKISTAVSPLPDGASPSPGFAVTIGGNFTATFILAERRRMAGARWFISVTVNSGGPGGSIVAAGPERRNGQWTRNRMEDILLSVLGAYERSLSEGGWPGSTTSGFRARGA